MVDYYDGCRRRGLAGPIRARVVIASEEYPSTIYAVDKLYCCELLQY